MTRVVVQRGQSSSSSRVASSSVASHAAATVSASQQSLSGQPSCSSSLDEDSHDQKECDISLSETLLSCSSKSDAKGKESTWLEAETAVGASSSNVVLDGSGSESHDGKRASQTVHFSEKNGVESGTAGLYTEPLTSQSEHVALQKLPNVEGSSQFAEDNKSDRTESKQECITFPALSSDGTNSGPDSVSACIYDGTPAEHGSKSFDTSAMSLPPYPAPLSSKRATLGSSVASSGTRMVGGSSRKVLRGVKSSKSPPSNSRSSSPRSYVEADGYNSADEQNPWSLGQRGFENDDDKERQFEIDIRRSKGLEVRRMAEDGNCLFRAVADQVYGDPEMHGETRQMCIDYMEKERDHYSQFVTESFSAYCKRKRKDKVFGNNLEIQAMAEMYNRPIHIYSYFTEPRNIFQGSYETDLPPIRLSYHRGDHYNSLVDPGRPTVGAGLGFGSLRGGNVDRDQVKAAIKAQQDLQIDKALVAEGRFYSDLELTEQEMERMVIEASRAEFLAEEYGYQVGCEESSTSAAGTSTSQGSTYDNCWQPTWHGSSGTSIGSNHPNTTLTPNMRVLLSMGFSYVRVVEACNIFGDDINDMLCYLLEAENGGLFEDSVYRMKGKAAERQ